MTHSIRPGDLVAWAVDLVCEELSETGIVLDLSESNAGLDGARIAWKSGVYWSPLGAIRNVKDFKDC